MSLFSNNNYAGFQQHDRRKYSGTIDGRKYGILLATKSDGFDTFALNKQELDDLLAAKRDGRIDEAKVVAAQNGIGGLLYSGEVDAEFLMSQFRGIEPRNGRFGPFYALSLYYFREGAGPF